MKVLWYTSTITIGCRLEQKTMYFLMMPLSLSGGSQETNTTELLEAAAFTPAGGPGTIEEDERVRVCMSMYSSLSRVLLDILLNNVMLVQQT